MAELLRKETMDLPEVKVARLLSAEELEACEKYVTVAYSDMGLSEDEEDAITGYYYLSTPGEEDNTIMLAMGSWLDEETEVDFYDYGPDDLSLEEYGTGNRPVLEFAEDLNINPGEKIKIGSWTFTIISKRLAFLDTYISTDIFDEETNVYEDAAIKERVDEWFENEIKPNL